MENLWAPVWLSLLGVQPLISAQVLNLIVVSWGLALEPTLVGGGEEKKMLPPLLNEAISLSKLGKNATKKERVSYSHRKLKLNQIIHQI